MHEKAAPLKSPEPMHGRDKLEASHKEKSLDSLDGSLHLNEALKDEDIKKCHREVPPRSGTARERSRAPACPAPRGAANPGCCPQEVIVPEGKWRKVSPASLSLSLPDADYQCIHRTSVSSLGAKESSFTSEEPLVSESAINTEEELEGEQSCVAELRPSDYQLLKIFIVLICLLVVSSSYLAFRIFRLEQQLCSLNRDYLSRGHRR
nr:PREDICTED: GRAM domain-containing protein 2-like [Apteryx mantelli mantelli]